MCCTAGLYFQFYDDVQYFTMSGLYFYSVQYYLVLRGCFWFEILNLG